MSIKPLSIILILLLVISFLSYDLFFKKNDSVVEKIIPPVIPTVITEVTKSPIETTKEIRAECVKEIGNYINENKDKKMTDSQMVFVLNSIYRICLAKNGLTPEDLLSPNSNSANKTYYEEQPSYTKEESLTDKWERERKQKCQEDINEYNLCMNEYNVKMAEYNTCLTEKLTNPYKFCYKSVNLCGFKPVCY